MGTVAKVFASFRSAVGLLWPFTAVHLAFRLGVAAIVLPLAAIVLSVALQSAGEAALTDQDIAWFLVTPAGFAGALALASLLIGAAVLDVAVMTAVLRRGEPGARAALVLGVRSIVPRFPALLRFNVLLVLRVLLIAAPFLLAATAVAFVWLREFDINYYLTYRPPAFLLAAGLIAALALALGLLLLARLSGWALAMHLVLFRRRAAAGAFGESARLLDGRRARLVGEILVWLLIRGLLFALVAGAAAAGIAAVPDAAGSNLRLIAAATLVLLLAWALVNALVAACANGALAHLLDRQYRVLTGDAPSPGPTKGPARARRPLALPAVAAAAAIALAGGAWFSDRLLDGIAADREVQVIAHRGAAAVRPENTLAAIERAVEDGADWVEIDVQENADGVVVVAHDSDFMKAAGVPVKVWEATTADLAGIDVGSWFDPAFAGERTPTLREALLAVRGRGRLLIELKYYGHDVALEERVAGVVEQTGMADDVAIMSLDFGGVQRFGGLRPGWPRGLLAARAIGDLAGLDVDFLAVNTGQASLQLIRRAHAEGKQVYVWTVDDPVTMSRMISMGVDGLITNDPALARRVVEARDGLSTPERLVLWLADRFDIGSFELVADESGA